MSFQTHELDAGLDRTFHSIFTTLFYLFTEKVAMDYIWTSYRDQTKGVDHKGKDNQVTNICSFNYHSNKRTVNSF